MAEDQTTDGQAGEQASAEQPAAFDPASAIVEVAGRKMSVADLQKSYVESESTMRKAQQDAHTYKTQLDNYSWANDLQTRYNQDPSFRQALDEALDSQGRQPIQELNPAYQELQSLKQEQALLRMERQFDQIRQDGFELTKDMEQKILQEIAANPAIQDATAAYRTLFWDQAIAQAREQAKSQTADQMSENQSAYSQPAKGSSSKPSKVSVKDMTQEQRDDYLMERIKELDMFSE